MNILQVQYFLSAAQTHSIHKTAEKYHLSPQGVSKAIKMLERELGLLLIERSTKGVELTADGEQLLLYFEALLENYQSIADYCRTVNDGAHPQMCAGVIDLAVTPRFSDTYFGKLMYKFNSLYPKIKLRADAMSNDKIISKMQSGQAEFHLAIITVANTETDINRLPDYLQQWHLQFLACYSQALYMCGLRKTIDKIGPIYHLHNNYAYPVVCYEYGGIMTAQSRQYDYQMDSITAQKELIDHHNAISAYSLDEIAMHFDRSKYAYIPFDDTVRLTYGCLFKSDYGLSEAEKIFLQFFMDYFDKMR